MIERHELKHYQRTSEASTPFSLLVEEIDLNLRWDSAPFLDADRQVLDGINKEIGDHVLRVRDFLKLPKIPHIRLRERWTEDVANRASDEEGVVADAYFHPYIPNFGIIRLSPEFLSEVVDEKMGRKKATVLPIPLVLGHEGFHLKQFIISPEEMQRDLDLHESGIMWTDTRTEKRARRFEEFWNRNWCNF